MRARLESHAQVAVLLVAGGCFLVFLSLRNEFLNPDGQALAGKFQAAVPATGAYVTHDEMLEFYVHSRLWDHAHRLFGWSVAYTYQVVSSAAGAVFVFVLLTWAPALSPAPAGLLLGVLTGGFMQLFFGDVENYTLVTLLIVLYLRAGHLFLEGQRTSVVAPSALLAAALCFHLLAGWLIPSLTYLHLVAARRGQRLRMAAGAVAFVLVVAATLAFFHFHHLPIRSLYYDSHAFGHGGDWASSLAPLSSRYYFRILNLLFLLFPSVLMLVPLLAFGRVGREPVDVFLAVAAASMAAFMLVWRAKIGVYNDWNLFAPGALVLSVLVWRSFLRTFDMPWKAEVFLGSTGLALLHTYCWVVSNSR